MYLTITRTLLFFILMIHRSLIYKEGCKFTVVYLYEYYLPLYVTYINLYYIVPIRCAYITLYTRKLHCTSIYC